MVQIKKVTREGDLYHVRYRPPSQFEKIRTPDWAQNVAESVSKGGKIRMGQTPAGTWLIQSILIAPKGVRGKNHAKSLAGRIRRKLEED